MVSSKDVSRRAGVSQPTVSRVLNNPESVKPDKREKVLRAMEELGYYPNLLARSLVTNSTKTIALISGTLKNGFFAETTDAIIHIAKQKGYKTIVYFEDENEIPNYWDSIMGHKVDGILLSLIRLDDANLKKIENSQVPCVFFNRKPRNESNYVVLDNVMAASILTEHILDLGHRRIAYISGQTDVSTFSERKVGFEETMKSAKVKQSPELTHYINTTNHELNGLIPRLVHMPEPPTAIICATDAMALICMDIVLSMGLRVPGDISIAGIDDTQMASHQAIQLTTVGHQKLAMGEIAAVNLIEMIEESSPREQLRQIILKPELVIRRTTTHLLK